MSENLPPLTVQTQQAILAQFRVAYGWLIILFAGIVIVALAWHCSLPKSYASGVPFG